MPTNSMNFETAFGLAMNRLRNRASKDSPEYNPDYEALVYMLAVGSKKETRHSAMMAGAEHLRIVR